MPPHEKVVKARTSAVAPSAIRVAAFAWKTFQAGITSACLTRLSKNVSPASPMRRAVVLPWPAPDARRIDRSVWRTNVVKTPGAGDAADRLKAISVGSETPKAVAQL